MSINEYKTALKNLIDATNDETLLKQWKTQMESSAEQKATKQKQDAKDEDLGYDRIESGLGIDE